jgi:alkanesulfonate monooxygenase SsuD/methylene tetrahydromethanopterin reductase-like flavin-dependent oxidoreductase (luciferase family)
MMQATDFRDGDDSSDAAMLNPALAAIAVLTERIRIGSFVMLMPFRDPLRIAEDGACVDNWSNGRLELGVGQGLPDRRILRVLHAQA